MTPLFEIGFTSNFVCGDNIVIKCQVRNFRAISRRIAKLEGVALGHYPLPSRPLKIPKRPGPYSVKVGAGHPRFTQIMNGV